MGFAAGATVGTAAGTAAGTEAGAVVGAADTAAGTAAGGGSEIFVTAVGLAVQCPPALVVKRTLETKKNRRQGVMARH